MTFRQQQARFLVMVGRLACYADALGVSIAVTEWYRTPERQAALVKQGKSKTYNSQHLRGLAVDLVILDGDGVTWDVARYRPLGAFWRDMGGVWGGDWTGLVDAVHFEFARKTTGGENG
jgi:peptidoglycan L-alanyl-D-glutamate endopeptidase CwlK